MPFKGPVWSDNSIPHTNKNADILKYGNVKNATVIEVKGGQYRSSRPLHGIFEMVNPSRDPRVWRGLRVEVYCLWHGVRPSSNWPNIDISGTQHTIIKDYCGEVVRDLG